VAITALEKDALLSLIQDMKPNIVMMGARFYECATPYQIGELKRVFPAVYFAALCIGYYPEELAMYFILNGAKSYVTTFYGLDYWYEGLENIRMGKQYIIPAINKCIFARKIYPESAKRLTRRRRGVVRFLCCGFRDGEIADMLCISKRTVDSHKTEIFRSLNVRSIDELIRAALTNGFVTLEEIQFYPKGLVLNPEPEKKKNARGRI
jgi:DNA-binding NarL/FixJ family response regulator